MTITSFSHAFVHPPTGTVPPERKAVLLGEGLGAMIALGVALEIPDELQVLWLR